LLSDINKHQVGIRSKLGWYWVGTGLVLYQVYMKKLAQPYKLGLHQLINLIEFLIL